MQSDRQLAGVVEHGGGGLSGDGDGATGGIGGGDGGEGGGSIMHCVNGAQPCLHWSGTAAQFGPSMSCKQPTYGSQFGLQ